MKSVLDMFNNAFDALEKKGIKKRIRASLGQQTPFFKWLSWKDGADVLDDDGDK